MPTYSYRCTECDTAFDITQAFTDDSLTVCPSCGGKLRKVFSAIGVSFTGSGFYRNDSRAEAKGQKSGSGDASATSGGDGGSGDTSGLKSSDSKSSDSKSSDAKSSDSKSSDSKSSEPKTSAPTASKAAAPKSPTSAPSGSRSTSPGA